LFVCLFVFVCNTGDTILCSWRAPNKRSYAEPLKDVDNVTTSYDNEARLHWLQWLLFCPPSSQQLSHSRILIKPDYLSYFQSLQVCKSKCSGSSTLQPLKSVNCGIHWTPKVHWKSGQWKVVFLGVGNICYVCIKDFKDWFWQIQESIILR
jgi:hypothetical protein